MWTFNGLSYRERNLWVELATVIGQIITFSIVALIAGRLTFIGSNNIEGRGERDVRFESRGIFSDAANCKCGARRYVFV